MRKSKLLGGFLVPALTALLSGCEGPSFLIGRLPGEPAAGGASSGGAGAGGTSGSTSATGGVPVDGEDCALPLPSHRFDFSGTGTALASTTGTLGAAILGGASLDGSGALALDGVDDYVALDASPLPGGAPFGVGVWVEYRGEAAFQRLFDFGTQGGPADNLVGTSYLALTPTTGFVPTGLAVLFSENGAAGEVAAVSDAVIVNGRHHVFVAVDEEEVALYLDGALVTRVPHAITLANFAPANFWLGRSQYAQDPYAILTYFDLSFFDEALAPCRVEALFDAGFPG